MARWSAIHPWRAIALWLVFVAACIALGNLTGLRQMTALDDTVGQSGTAEHWLHDAGLQSPDTETVLITSRAGPLDLSAAQRAAAAATTRLRALASVSTVEPAQLSRDRSAVAVTATIPDDNASVTPLLDATAAVQKSFPGLRVEEVGSLSVSAAVNKQVASDLSAAATYSLPVTLLIMLVAFGAILAAGVPILLALSAVGAATGLSAVVSHVLPDSGSTSSLILLMGMAVGVDYSLFYVKRARAERHRLGPDDDPIDAIEVAARTSGHSVWVSGLAVIVSMMGLYLAGDLVFASLATGSIIVVAIAVLGSLTVLPAVLAKLGPRIDRPRVPVLWRWTMPDRPRAGRGTAPAAERAPRFWPVILRPALERPGRTLTITVLALGVIALPALGMRLTSDSQRSLPDSIAIKAGLDRLTHAFPSQNATDRIVVKAPAASAGAVAVRLHSLAATLSHHDGFLPPGPDAITASADGTVHVLAVDVPYDAEAGGARNGVSALRSDLVPQALSGLDGARWAVGGEPAAVLDTDRHLADRMPWVIGFVVVLTVVVVGFAFRSVLLALTTAAMNLLSAGVAFGVLVLVFQQHWAEGLLGFHSTGAVINWIPLFTFAILFGLSMDYHVFVLSQVREAAETGMPVKDVVRAGLLRSAGTVTSAAVVMVSVFSIFAGLHMIEMKELGLGLAVAVLIDAVVVRVIVLPSVLMLLGRWAWWPGRLSRQAGSADRSLAGLDRPGRELVGGGAGRR